MEDLAPLVESQIGGFVKPPISFPTSGPAVPPKGGSGMPVPQHFRFPSSQTNLTTPQLSHMTAIQRSKIFRAARMEPHLQVRVVSHVSYPILLTVFICASSCAGPYSSTLILLTPDPFSLPSDMTPLMNTAFGTVLPLSLVSACQLLGVLLLHEDPLTPIPSG